MLSWLIEIYLCSNGYVISYMVSFVLEFVDVGTWPLKQYLFHVSKNNLSCGMKRLDVYKTKENYLKDEVLECAICVSHYNSLITHNNILSRKWVSFENQFPVFKHSQRYLRACIFCVYLRISLDCSVCISFNVFILFADKFLGKYTFSTKLNGVLH